MRTLILMILGLGLNNAFAGSPCHKEPLLLGKKEGGGVANGGDGYEGEFCHYANKLEGWITRNRLANLKLADGVSSEEKTLELLMQFDDVELEFTDQSIVIEGKIRTCENTPDQMKIRCNKEQWKSENPSAHYITVFHEFLGLAGLEGNSGTISTYPIASQLVPFFEERTYVELRDEAKETLSSYIRCDEHDSRYKQRFFIHKNRALSFFFFPKSEHHGYGQGYIVENLSPWMHEKKRNRRFYDSSGKLVGAGTEFSEISLQKNKKDERKVYSFFFKNSNGKYIDSDFDFLLMKNLNKKSKGTSRFAMMLTSQSLAPPDGIRSRVGQLLFYETSYYNNRPDYLIGCYQEFKPAIEVEEVKKSLSKNALKTE